MKKLYFYLFLILSLCISGCGYRIGSLLPGDLKTVYVPMFKNNTAEPVIESLVTNGIIREFIADGTLKTAKEDEADTMLIGEIIDYKRDPLRYTGQEVTNEYRLSIIVKLKFFDIKRNTLMWENSRVEGYTTFFVNNSLPESERIALPKAIIDLAHQVVEKVVEGGW